MKLYLDMCVYNRPFDEQNQPRVLIETQIFVVLLMMVSQGHIDVVHSFALAYENSKNPNPEKRIKIADFLKYSREYVSYDENIFAMAVEYESRGLDGMDALHVACAEKAKADFFVTCDDALLRRLRRVDNAGVSCCSLIELVGQEVFQRAI